jgi:hypothetical protein
LSLADIPGQHAERLGMRRGRSSAHHYSIRGSLVGALFLDKLSGTWAYSRQPNHRTAISVVLGSIALEIRASQPAAAEFAEGMTPKPLSASARIGMCSVSSARPRITECCHSFDDRSSDQIAPLERIHLQLFIPIDNRTRLEQDRGHSGFFEHDELIVAVKFLDRRPPVRVGISPQTAQCIAQHIASFLPSIASRAASRKAGSRQLSRETKSE